jgi:hypothetical protein
MRQRRMLAAAALLATAVAAHAEHFEYRIDLSGTYTVGGTGGCSAADTTGCPRAGTLSGLMSFDTPGSADGSWSIMANFGDITDFHVDLGSLGSEDLYGGINLVGGAPSGSVQPLDQTETFTFDWASRSASYDYDFGYHNPNGAFTGTLSTVPAPAPRWLFLAGIAGLAVVARRRSRTGA